MSSIFFCAQSGSARSCSPGMISVGVVAEGKYLTRDGVREPEQIFKREIEQNAWIKDHLSVGQQVGHGGDAAGVGQGAHLCAFGQTVAHLQALRVAG